MTSLFVSGFIKVLYEWVSYLIMLIVHVLLLSGDGWDSRDDRPWAVGDFIFSFIARLQRW